MISEERLKELKQDKNNVIYGVDSEVVEIRVGNLYYSLSNDNYQYASNLCIYEFILNDLYETKEDAEFALRYKRIPKTEYLDLPEWEEIENILKESSSCNFCDFDNILGYITPDKRILLNDYKCNSIINFNLFEKPLTKENYLKACELCRKLWLGEEV